MKVIYVSGARVVFILIATPKNQRTTHNLFIVRFIVEYPLNLLSRLILSKTKN